MRIKKFSIFEGGGGKIKGYQSFGRLYESEAENAEVIKRIRKAILWIAINKGFYGELLSHLNVYGSSEINPPTMCTNGRDIIFHPNFVKSQSDEAIRFVLIHEILHCVGNHMERIGTRNPKGWNIACDYAINPLIKDESGVAWPETNGKRQGLYEARFEGMRAEDIYDILEKSGELDKLMGDPDVLAQSETGKIIDITETPELDPDMKVQDGDFPIDSDEDDSDQDGEQEGPSDGESDDQEGEGSGEQEGEGSGEQEGEGSGEQEGDQDGDESGDQAGDQSGDQGDKQSGDPQSKDKESDGEKSKESLRPGQTVILDNGKKAIIKRVYPNGDIEV
jgi:hypothetical protein